MSTESAHQSEIMTGPEEKGCWGLKPLSIYPLKSLPNWTDTLEGQIYFPEFVFL